VGENQVQRIPAQTMRRMVRTGRPQPSPKAQALHWPVFIAYLVCWGCALALLLWKPKGGLNWAWPAGILFVVGTLTSLVSLARRLPVQNVVACGIVILALAAVVTTVGTKAGLPFGYFEGYTRNMGPRLFNLMPWSVPFLWFVILYNSRDVAKLILRPWRREKQYGFWLVGVAAVLTVAMDFILEPFAVRVQEWWSWRIPIQASSIPARLNWLGVPWTSFVGWFVCGSLILVFAGPWLTTRRPFRQHADLHPVILWASFGLLFATGNALAQLWAPALFGAVATLLVAGSAWRNGRRVALGPPPPPGAPLPPSEPPRGPPSPPAPPGSPGAPPKAPEPKPQQ
jgi:uncharacterized membrane protein